MSEIAFDFAGLKYVLLSQNPRTLECVVWSIQLRILWELYKQS